MNLILYKQQFKVLQNTKFKTTVYLAIITQRFLGYTELLKMFRQNLRYVLRTLLNRKNMSTNANMLGHKNLNCHHCDLAARYVNMQISLKPGRNVIFSSKSTSTKITLYNHKRQSQWPRSLRRHASTAPVRRIAGSNPTLGMDVCPLSL